MATKARRRRSWWSRSGARSGAPTIQRATLIGLGLNKMHKRRTLIDSPQVRGMVAKISHLVRIVDEERGSLRKKFHAIE